MSDRSFVCDFLDIAAREPNRLFARFKGADLTFGQLRTRACNFAAHAKRLGLSPGTRAAVMMDNGFETICVIFGLALAGVAWVPINPRLVSHSLAYHTSYVTASLDC